VDAPDELIFTQPNQLCRIHPVADRFLAGVEGIALMGSGIGHPRELTGDEIDRIDNKQPFALDRKLRDEELIKQGFKPQYRVQSDDPDQDDHELDDSSSDEPHAWADEPHPWTADSSDE
jgi:hypothetical protein